MGIIFGDNLTLRELKLPENPSKLNAGNSKVRLVVDQGAENDKILRGTRLRPLGEDYDQDSVYFPVLSQDGLESDYVKAYPGYYRYLSA